VSEVSSSAIEAQGGNRQLIRQCRQRLGLTTQPGVSPNSYDAINVYVTFSASL
jgi:hypothetical protein